MFDPDSKMGGLQNLADLPTCHVTFGPCNIWSFGMTIGMAGAPKKEANPHDPHFGGRSWVQVRWLSISKATSGCHRLDTSV